MFKLLISGLFLLAMMSPSVAGEPPPPPPGTDIWLADAVIESGHLRLSEARNLTSRAGYDNQPAFLPDGTLLYTAAQADGQTDAWRLSADGTSGALLATPQSEYSPTPVPGGGISVVRVALDGTQQLWWLPPGGSEYQLLFPLIEGVGYHAWLDAERVALFLVREPSELHVASRRDGEVLVLARDIGRSLHAVPGATDALAFIEAGSDGKPWIKRYDFADRRIVPLAPALADSQDFAFLPDGTLLMASGREIHAFRDEQWQRIAVFEELPGEITRLAVSPDGSRLAFVAGEAD